MKEIKKMLLGNAIMLAVIIFHLFYINTALWTDFIGIIGLILVIKGYCAEYKENDAEQE